MRVRIKFNSKQDQVTGFYELATKGRGRSLSNGVFEMADRYLKILDEVGAAYIILQNRQLNENP